MKLIVIGSSSKGNAYALAGEKETLLLEAGVPFSKVRKALSYATYNVVGCCISHRHGDHASHASEYHVPIYCNEDTDNAVEHSEEVHRLKEGVTVKAGSFSVTPFHVKHDVENFGYLIHHPEMGTLLFATDTDALPYRFENVNHWLIEANYSDAIIKENFKQGKIDKHQVDRIMLSHMSLDYCVKYLRDCQADRTARTITLCHLSERNSDPKQFRDTVAGAFAIPTFIAQRGLVINLCTSV
jgi:glyoxylase-like metal-dependent hydrolase (beta-lactamase superfamily II)